MIIWVLVVVVVVFLVFLTINLSHKNKMPENNTNNEVQAENTVPVSEGTQAVNTTPSAAPANTGAKVGDMVTVNYTGKLTNGTVFDSNVDPKFGHVQPFQFNLGAGQVIVGWDKGIVGMKVGDKKTLVIPPEEGYGATGAGGVIPPNATLTFDVEVLKITSVTTTNQ